MLKVRDPIYINEVATYMEKQSSELKTAQVNLINHINDILNNYQGNDALAIVTKFQEKAKQLDGIITNVDYYVNYMKTIANYDTDNLNDVKNNLNTIDITTNSLPTLNINLNRNDGDFNG